MADNVRWWHDVQAPGAKMVLWAHNMHVVKRFDAMGQHLARQYGSAYLNVALTFGRGTFNAVLSGERTDTLPGQRIHTVPGLYYDSIEAIFNATGLPRMIFDARAVRGPVSPEVEPLLSILAIRTIGASYRISGIGGYHVALQLWNDYDLIVWFAESTPTQLRSFTTATSP
jgi:erythromycin esterase